MNTFFRFKSLRTRLAFWFLLVTMLCLVAVVTTLYFQRSAIIRISEFEKLEIGRDLKVRDLNNWLEERTSDLQVASGDDEIRGLKKILSKIKDSWTTEDLKAVSIARALMRRYLGASLAYHEVFFIEANSGRVAISSDATREGDDKREDPYFIEPMRIRKPFIKDIFDSKTEGTPAMAFAAPVFCLEHDGEHLIGVLVMRVDLEHSLYPLIHNRIGAGETGETLIVNKDGFPVNNLRWHESAPLKLKINAEPAVRAARGETGIVESKDYRGEMVLAAYTYIPQMGWGLVVKRDLAEIYAPIDAMLRQMVILVLFSLFVVLLVSLFLSGTIVRPVANIGAIVRRFTEGDLDARCSTIGVDEVVILGTLFNKMAATLSSQRTIQQRTSEVADTMVAAGDMEKFASGLLLKLIDISGSHLGAFYLRSEDGQRLEPIASVGLSGDAAYSFSAKDHEGELGQALATGKISCLKDISPDTSFTFRTTGGTTVPREIMTIPLIVDKRIMAVVSLATLSAYSDTHREIIDRAQIGMNTALSNMISVAKTLFMALELQGKNMELEAQTQELQAMTDDLKQQNIELDAQSNQLEEANRLKSQFLSNMSHELRTPLNSIMALSSVLKMNAAQKLDTEEAEYLDVIKRNGKRLLDLINDILDLSKIEAGHMDVTLSFFSLKTTIEDLLDSLRPLAKEKEVSLQMEIAPDLPKIQSDEKRVHQILLNLLSNAVKFTEKGDVNVLIDIKDDRICLKVIDTGIGIAQKDLPFIFDEFKQVDGSTSRYYEGTGLGLAIAYKATINLGGELSVESTLGQGTTFTLSLPVTWQGESHRTEPLYSVQPSQMIENRKTVLVVDDDPKAVDLIADYLSQERYNILKAASGAQALRLAKEHRPFAITLDLIMPEMDGLETLQRLKQTSETSKIPVIIISISDDRKIGLPLGAVGHVTKPVIRDRLIKEINKVCAQPVSIMVPEAIKKHKKRILVVEDNRAAIIQIKMILEQEGYIVDTAGGGEEAQKIIEQTIPDGIILDLMMPDIDGFDVLEKLRGTKKTAKIPVLILTAKDLTPDDFKKLSTNNIQQLVQKGDVEREGLVLKVKTMLGEKFKPIGSVTTNAERAKESEIKSHSKTPRSKTRISADILPTILIIEDNPDNMLTIKAVLKNRYTILEAMDGEEGLKRALHELPDLVLLDISLPGMDGYTVVKEIKSNEKTNSMPVIALTAHTMKGDRDKAILAGCDDYLSKPIDPEKILETIEKWLEQF